MKLLIDGDVYIYKALHAVGEATEWPGELWTWHTDLSRAKRALEMMISDLLAHFDTDEYLIALSDPKGNWRKQLYPEYKANRKEKKPLCYPQLFGWLFSNHPSEILWHAEADDVLGIRHTEPGADTIIVSIDKDMRTLPGKLANPDNDLIVEEICETGADYNHLLQALTGDAVDNYPGCPRVGKVTAPRILGEPADFDFSDAWARVVAQYEKAGLTEQDATVQAQLARILRHGEYDEEERRCLWQPT